MKIKLVWPGITNPVVIAIINRFKKKLKRYPSRDFDSSFE